MSLKEKLGLLSATILTVGFGAAAPAHAQQAAPAATAEDEAIVVTGSRIRRDPANAPAPLIQVTQEDLLMSGQPNLVDYLSDIPALSASTVPEDTTGSNLNDGGLDLLNLRDLGAVRTLVLVDGRRHVGAPQGGLQVDVSTIPSLLLESVEVVTGGQSALYGTDAVTGVVNFITKDDFSGIDVDAAFSQINQDGQMGNRVSALIGHNFFDDRLNLYFYAERREQDQVRDEDIDWKKSGWALLNNDSDVNNATPDGQLDNILIRDARDAFFHPGSVVVVANQVLNSPAADPDLSGGNCGAQTAANVNASSANISGAANCYNIAPENLSTFVFGPTGTSRPFNFGTFQDQNGTSRRVNIGGDGLNVGTEFGQFSRIPENTQDLFQAGLNFDLLDNVRLFMEAKMVKEETFDEGQPTFFQGGIGQAAPGVQNAIFSTTNFNISDDNAFLDPILRNRILTNTRNSTATSAAQVADRRATFNMFGPRRTQYNERTVNRYVAGLRGDLDSLLILNDVDWEVYYTYGNTHNENSERGVDVIRFHYALDAVRDTAGVLGTANAIVCRSRLLQAQGFTVVDPLTGTVTAANNAALAACVPQSMFGVDMRTDGYNPAAESYYNATIKVEHDNHQQNAAAFLSGSLWDFWGAGPIGLAVGHEWRREKTGGVGRDTGTAGRFLFLNTGPDFAPARYNVTESFVELKVPLFRDSWLGESAEFSGAYRASDYSTVGTQESRSVQIQWRPVSDILLRATYGESVRVPNLTENFAPATQTFANGVVDPCDANAINAQVEPIRSNRIANCMALATANGFNPALIYPGTGSTTGFYQVGTANNGTYASGRSGLNSGNPFLQPEHGRSYTWSIAYTPSWFDDFRIVFDYYDIKITDAIAAVTAQAALNQCVNGPSLNTGACATIFRNPVAGDPSDDFQLPQAGVGFIQGSLNYAQTMAKGVDFNASYHIDMADTFGVNWGELDFGLRGNYLIRQEDFTDIANPGFETVFDTTIGLPRTRFQFQTSWSPTEDLAFTMTWDWQASQEIVNELTLVNNSDDRDPKFLTTGDYSQFDFAARWDIFENFELRGGVVNAFDAEPARWLGSATTADNFDLFGRRFFIGARFRH